MNTLHFVQDEMTPSLIMKQIELLGPFLVETATF